MDKEPSFNEMLDEIVEVELRDMLDNPEYLRRFVRGQFASFSTEEIRTIYYQYHPDYKPNDNE